MGDGGGEPVAQPSTGACGSNRGRPVPQPIYHPQTCRLCARETVYLTRSGLSDHATVHHGHWYSSKQDRYIPIPEADLAAKCRLVKLGRSHRKFRKDPADTPNPADGQDRPPKTVQSSTGQPKRSSVAQRNDMEQETAMDMVPLPDTQSVVRRPRSPSERRVTTCKVDLGGVWYTPAATSTAETGMASDTRDPRGSSSEGGMELAPSAKVSHREEKPETSVTLAPYRLPPVEDDEFMGGDDAIVWLPKLREAYRRSVRILTQI